MTKRAYVALPAKLTPQVEEIAASLAMNVNEFGVHCLEACVAAIQADTLGHVSFVRHARRILRKDVTAGDRLLLNLLEKAFPDLPKDNDRLRELLIEETNLIQGDLTPERLKAAHSQALARWRAEEKRMADPVGELAKIKLRRSAKSK
jgi:hypothetical protein